MVTDVSEHRLVMLFIEGLADPLCGWVKAFKSQNLQDDMIREQDTKDAIPKNKPQSKPFIPQKNKYKKPFQKEWIGINKLDGETQNELRRNKLCFSCKEPWDLGNLYMGKGKVHYIKFTLGQ